jgi:hypothetical protein
MDTAIDEFRTKVICNRISGNRPMELAENIRLKLTTKQHKHLQKCKVPNMRDCQECQIILRELEK